MLINTYVVNIRGLVLFPCMWGVQLRPFLLISGGELFPCMWVVQERTLLIMGYMLVRTYVCRGYRWLLQMFRKILTQNHHVCKETGIGYYDWEISRSCFPYKPESVTQYRSRKGNRMIVQWIKKDKTGCTSIKNYQDICKPKKQWNRKQEGLGKSFFYFNRFITWITPAYFHFNGFESDENQSETCWNGNFKQSG